MEINLPGELSGTHWVDCSSLRPVPDNQEVFMHSTRTFSIIIEVLESSPMTAREHFQELAEMNEADDSGLIEGFGEGEAGGWQDLEGQRAWIGVGLRREEKADLLVSINSQDEKDLKFLTPLMRSLVIKDPKLFDE